MPEVSDYGIWQNVCTRCHNALHEMGIARPHAGGRLMTFPAPTQTLSHCPLFTVHCGGRPVSFPAPRKLPWLLLISAAVIVADRHHEIARGLSHPIGDAIPVIPGFLRISHWLNEGAAFSLFADSASPNAVRWGLDRLFSD